MKLVLKRAASPMQVYLPGGLTAKGGMHSLGEACASSRSMMMMKLVPHQDARRTVARLVKID